MNADFYRQMGLDISEVKMPGVISSTPLGTALTCPRKYLFSYLLGLTPTRRRRALDFGSVVHVGLEWWYRSSDVNLAVAKMAESWDAAVGEGLDEPGDHRTLSVGQELLRQYINEKDATDPLRPFRFSDGSLAIEHKIMWQPTHSVRGDGRVLTEEEVRKHLENPGKYDLRIDPLVPIYVGNLDMLVSRPDGIWVCDHKTTSQMGPTWSNAWSPSLQMLGYACAADKLLESLGHKERVQGVLINGLKVTKSIIKADGTLAPVVKTTDTTKSNIAFQRVTVAMTAGQKEEFAVNYAAWVDRLRSAVQDLSFPANWTSCHDYGGCQFRDLCSADISSRHRILCSQFTEEEPWNPLDR